ncbi:MAG: aminomethyl-transferring glycine dehydrogenase [Pseudobdellovibrionaceae bacterium]
MNGSPSSVEGSKEFASRHIGPRDADVAAMLKDLGFKSLEDMAARVIPANIRSHRTSGIGAGLTENELLTHLKSMVSKNKIMKSMIGMGYSTTITPTVIQRNILENPVWYTAYTPYQAEIAQGRLEAILNFQTMVKDLTGLEVSNASLLDEGTAAAEALAMAYAVNKRKDASKVFVADDLHPHAIEVLKTRASALDIELVIQKTNQLTSFAEYFCVFLQYPNTYGSIEDYKNLAEKAHQSHAMVIVGTDLMALTLLTPPGEWGADIAYGNSQRFGVPLGFGGPHAAFIATKEVYKRSIPGRIVGVSVDAQGKKAYRLALQTREQHIRREKATSNICTAQVLLANMASMYAVYHGPQGLKKIAQRIHSLTHFAATMIQSLGITVLNKNYFDTLTLKVTSSADLLKKAEIQGYNFRKISADTVGIAFDETSSEQTIQDVFTILKHHLGNVQDTAKNPVEQYQAWLKNAEVGFAATFQRQSDYLTHPVFNSHHSETQLLRYIHSLQNKDITLTHSMIPLGSCTMKLNATTELVPVSWPEINQIHPFAPLSQTQGYLEMIHDLERKLCQITGFAAVSLQPNAGSQGEYAGLLVIKKYLQSIGQGHRKICLIPSSAHGTNPASAVMVGFEIQVVACDDQGNVDISDLKAKALLHKDNLAALMVTYPSTHGVFEEGITEICEIIHAHGGQVYMDGANMNALVEVCQPGQFGPDVSHMNLHKTFSIPHGGGGPGIGPIGVRAHLKAFLPTHAMVPECGPSTGVGTTTSAPWGSASILPISWAYITMMGEEGLKNATLISILSANYIAKNLETHYPILYKGKQGLVAHECILDLRGIKKTSGIDVTDVAKRLMDYGFHAPTMSWPVAGTLMVEPTESESKEELDRFIEAMIQIRNEIKMVENGSMTLLDNPLVHAPHTAEVLLSEKWDRSYSRETAAYPLAWIRKNKFWPTVSRIDNAYGDKNFICSCPPIDEYQS